MQVRDLPAEDFDDTSGENAAQSKRQGDVRVHDALAVEGDRRSVQQPLRRRGSTAAGPRLRSKIWYQLNIILTMLPRRPRRGSSPGPASCLHAPQSKSLRAHRAAGRERGSGGNTYPLKQRMRAFPRGGISPANGLFRPSSSFDQNIPGPRAMQNRTNIFKQSSKAAAAASN